MLNSLSTKSYMRIPRSVTMQPIFIPVRSLNAATDFLAFVIIGFCPVINDKSFTAASSQPAFEFDMAGAVDPAGGVPEASTWGMLVLGFAGLGYAASRRNANDRLPAKTI